MSPSAHLAARTGARCADALPLGGSALVWFDARGLDAAAAARLSAPRAALCGMTLDRPRIMGILNVTPDSFSDGGDFHDHANAVARARAMVPDVDILDIGGESTRPGSDPVGAAEEIRRTAPVIRAIRDAGIDGRERQ